MSPERLAAIPQDGGGGDPQGRPGCGHHGQFRAGLPGAGFEIAGSGVSFGGLRSRLQPDDQPALQPPALHPAGPGVRDTPLVQRFRFPERQLLPHPGGRHAVQESQLQRAGRPDGHGTGRQPPGLRGGPVPAILGGPGRPGAELASFDQHLRQRRLPDRPGAGLRGHRPAHGRRHRRPAAAGSRREPDCLRLRTGRREPPDLLGGPGPGRLRKPAGGPVPPGSGPGRNGDRHLWQSLPG
ncbi:MAG: hypothetical protein BWY73_01534 [candidate division TA06 bacterium ADurb.Bin417]|uniref:Uncharacterized protein n=1 Tax=candidate division TA06 bacterium ADurb.Bin417 TaxID=1852828 RepID=A0A1V5M7V8_UNCT6|nr:MAG: hypothetical protein BWY73_01534 [candidate division TA06 bacterium ADurb.Bin417]